MFKKIYSYLPRAKDVLFKKDSIEKYTLKEALEIVPVGTKIKFNNEKQRYTVMARNEKYIIMSKANNLPRLDFFYSIIDIENMEMSSSDLIFDFTNYLDKEECEEVIKKLEKGEVELSARSVGKCENLINEIWIEVKPVRRSEDDS